MIFINKNNNQSEKNSNLIARNDDVVSTESSLKKLVDVNDDEEDIYHRVLSDHSKTINYDNLKYGDNNTKTTDEKAMLSPEKGEPTKPEKKSLQKQMYKKAVREKNYAQIEQNFESTEASDASTAYTPPLPTRVDYPKSTQTTSFTAADTAESSNNGLVSSESNTSELVRSTSLINDDNYVSKPRVSGFRKNLKARQFKAVRDSRKPKTFSVQNDNYTVIHKKADFHQTDGRVVLDGSTSNTSKVSASFSKTNTDKVLSSSLYELVGDEAKPNRNRYESLVKRHQLRRMRNIKSSDIDTSGSKSVSDSFSASASDNVTLQEDTKPINTLQNNLINSKPEISMSGVSAAGEQSSRNPKIKSVTFKKQVLNAAVHRQREKAKTVRMLNNRKAKGGQVVKKTSDNALNAKKPPSMKSQFSSSCKDLVKSTTDRIYFGSKKNLYDFAKNGAENSAVDNPEARGAQAAFELIETTKNAKYAVSSAINAANGTANVVKGTYNGIKSSQRFIKRVKKMNLAQVKKFSELKLKKSLKSFKSGITAKAKAAIAAVLAVFCSFLLTIMFAFALLAAVVSSVTWQQSSELDTTQLVKYISSLDKDMQDKWYKGKTAAEIARQNDNPDARFDWQYDYYVAYNKLPDELPAPDDIDPEFNCYVKVKYNPENGSETVGQKGYTQVAHSKDEFLEIYRWTTEDYITALAYLQVKNENLGWFASTFGWVGETVLKNKAAELHELTYGKQIYIYENAKTGAITYSLENGAVLDTETMVGDTKRYCYFGRKNSVKFLVENDLLPTPLTEDEKERFEYICKYGNIELAVLNYPLDGDIDIAKHFGEQKYLKFTSANDSESYPSVSAANGKHYAVDLNATAGDIIKSPFKGYCKVIQQDKRGFEFVISTNSNFELGDKGFLCRISCASASYIPTNTIIEVEAGQSLGVVSSIQGINTEKPTGATDVFADKLYPCGTNTDYHNCDSQGCMDATYTGEYVHLELYKLPCDFTSAADMEKNVLAPELCFIYPEDNTTP